MELKEQYSKKLLQKHINKIKMMIEEAIKENTISGSAFNKKGEPYINGAKAKEALIRSQSLIYELHEFVKEEFISYGVKPEEITPPLGQSKPERKLIGFFKAKDQDVCIIPQGISEENEECILATNVRSQLSSVNKNIDTLFERMIAEALNLHRRYPQMVLGELYMIPVFEYDDAAMKSNQVKFKKKQTDIEKFIDFFSLLNHYDGTEQNSYKYDRAALVVVNFSLNVPKIYFSTDELKGDGLVSESYQNELGELSPVSYVSDLLNIYDEVFG